ncbi:hypothetical protein [Pseudomonas syringae]|uniref:hypothetical protein n=1 Tax=Pseudomonas syringae TaxID=317 RepID=UPI0002A7B252|nr:hypothetical protein [Pseudomonas syringae]ELP97474.1 hypothetical protein A979_19795 [Pseudomonas syringae BRIP34876]ELP99134.1 hypothetical protein A987_20200 [Pseudomonas syringae BRIP34881]
MEARHFDAMVCDAMLSSGSPADEMYRLYGLSGDLPHTNNYLVDEAAMALWNVNPIAKEAKFSRAVWVSGQLRGATRPAPEWVIPTELMVTIQVWKPRLSTYLELERRTVRAGFSDGQVFYTRTLLEKITHAFGAEQRFPNYDRAFARLRAFIEEEENWDDCGGMPANENTGLAVETFLYDAQRHRIARPSLTLSNSGAVSVTWKNGHLYISVLFKGLVSFSVVILDEGQVASSFECEFGRFPDLLKNILLEKFKDDI